MRLTGTSYAVLSVLDALGPATPYDLKQALVGTVQNFWPIPHTTFYSEPERLARGGLLSVEQEPSGRRRKVYALTDAGHETLSAWAASASLSPPQLREEGVLKIFAGADPVPILRERLDWHAREARRAAGLSRGGRRGSRQSGRAHEPVRGRSPTSAWSSTRLPATWRAARRQPMPDA